jgi:3-hydroxybutyryl-CoA dehydratase
VSDETFSSSVESLSADKMKVLALLLDDPNPIHFDPTETRRLGISDRPVNQGPASMAIVANLLQAHFPDARLARLTTMFLGHSFAGDALDAGGRVVDRVEDGDSETITCDVWLTVRGGQQVLTGSADLVRPTAGA